MAPNNRPPPAIKHLTCSHCHGAFTWAAKPGLTPKYCSGRCRRHACATRLSTPPPGSPTYTCQICGTSFQAIGKEPKYCGKTCKDKANHRAQKARKAALKTTTRPTPGQSHLTALTEQIARKGGIREWLDSGPEVMGDMKRALERYALKLPYDQYEQCHRLMNRTNY